MSKKTLSAIEKLVWVMNDCYMIILAGFKTPMCIFMGSARNRKILYAFFQELTEYLERKGISNRKLVTDRLYRRYVRFSDLEETFNIMKNIEHDFISEKKKQKEMNIKYFFLPFTRV